MEHQNTINPMGCSPRRPRAARPVLPSSLPSAPVRPIVSCPSDRVLSVRPCLSAVRPCPSDMPSAPVRPIVRPWPSDLPSAPVRPIVRPWPSDWRVDTYGWQSAVRCDCPHLCRPMEMIWAVRSVMRPQYASSALGGQYKGRTAIFVRSERRWAW
jgi:hypothetical protein